MKTVSSGIVDALLGYDFIVAEVYVLTLADGSVYRYTSGDGDVRWLLYESIVTAVAMPIEREDITLSTGVSVDDCKVSFYCDDSVGFNGLTIPNFALIGGFDNAIIQIYLAIMTQFSYADHGLIHLFEGKVSDVELDVFKVTLTVSSPTILLNMQVPRAVYQPSCIHTLYDGRCAVDKGSYTTYHTVFGSDPGGTLSFADTNPGGHYLLAQLTFTSGLNAGLSRSISAHVLDAGYGYVFPGYPFPFVPAIGDTFSISLGCDKSRAMCAARFANEAQFLGFEYMPVPEASI